MAPRPESGPPRPAGRESDATAAEKRPYSEGFGFGAVSFAAGAGVGLLSAIVIARIYGIEVVGEFALATAPVGVVWVASTFQEVPALVRALATLRPRDPRVTALFTAVFAFSSVVTAAVAGVGVVITYLVFNGPIDRPDLIAPAVFQLGVYVLVINSSWLLDAIFASFRSGRDLFWIRLNQAVAYLAFAIAFSFIAESVWSVVAAASLSWVPALLHRLIAVQKWMRMRIQKPEMREGFSQLGGLIRFGLKLTPGRISEGVSNELGTWVLGATASIAAVGAWNRAWTVGKRVQDLNNRFSEMLLPTLVERGESGDRAGFERALVDSMRYVAIALLLPAAVIGGAADSVMAVFGPGFERAGEALALLMLALPIAALVVLQHQALLATNRPWLASSLGFLRLGVTAAAIVPATLAWGITGAAVSALAGSLAQFAAQAVALRPQSYASARTLWPRRAMLALGLAYICGFSVARLAEEAIVGLAALLVAIPAGTATYLLALLVFGAVLPRDRSRISAILRSSRARGSGKTPHAIAAGPSSPVT